MRRGFAVAALVGAATAGYLVGASVGVGGSRRSLRFVETPVGGLATPIEISLPRLPEQPVRNLILAVGDGMGISELAAAGVRAFGVDGGFVIERLPLVGLAATAPADGLITKSEAAATALACGVRTPIGPISMAADGSSLPTILERAAAAGLATGLVTTSEIYDATPAAFYAHVKNRRAYGRIVDQLVAAPVDLVFGGGLGRVRREAVAAARRRGVDMAWTPEEMSTATRLPLWALFSGDRLGEKPAHPTVAEMAAKAIELLTAEGAGRSRGFLLMVEEEGMDTAGHANDLEGMTAAALRFDAAVTVAARFAAHDGETLVVVLGDHGTGGVTIESGGRAGTMRVGWASNQHDAGPVAVRAYGPDDALRALAGTRDHADLGRRMTGLLLGEAG